MAREYPRFYKPPTPEEESAYGRMFAEVRARIRAERIRSRVFSGFAAVATGSLITITDTLISGPPDPRVAIGHFAAPLVVNVVAEIRAERAQRREITRVGEMAVEVKTVTTGLSDEIALLQHQLVAAQEENDGLREVIAGYESQNPE